VHWARHFILFHGKRHPIEMGEVEVGQFLQLHSYKPMSRPQRGQSRGIGYLVRKGAPQYGHRQNRRLTYTPATAIAMDGRKSHTVRRLIN
jgi:hypothetical protein